MTPLWLYQPHLLGLPLRCWLPRPSDPTPPKRSASANLQASLLSALALIRPPATAVHALRPAHVHPASQPSEAHLLAAAARAALAPSGTGQSFVAQPHGRPQLSQPAWMRVPPSCATMPSWPHPRLPRSRRAGSDGDICFFPGDLGSQTLESVEPQHGNFFHQCTATPDFIYSLKQ